MPTKTLHQAAMQGDIEQLNLHIARGADLNKADKGNMTALARATMTGRLEAVKVLVAAGADINGPSFMGPPIVVAVSRMQREIVEFLVAEGADVNAKGRGGQTALIAAASVGQQEVVELLVAKGADVNAANDQGQTALMAARGFPAIAEFLRQNGAQAPTIAYGEGPYGRPGMGGGMVAGGEPGYRAMQERPDVLADPNALRAKIAAIPGLAKRIESVDANAASEERSWASRRSDNRATLIRSAGKQFAEELAFLKSVATEDKAAKTSAAIDELAAKRRERDAAIGSELREARRLALQQARAAAGRGRGRGASRGRSARGGSIQGYDDPTGMANAGPYGQAEPGRMAGRARRTEDVEEPPLDPDTAMMLEAWLSANPEDKRTLLASVHDMDLFELEGLQQIATEEDAKKTTAAIEGLMLARQTRVERIREKMAEEDARLERLAERAGGAAGMRSRRGRDTLQAEQPQGQVPTTSRRGRRSR
ncbi:MAG: ankyrin repeat domain-containing protein [Phycisphaerales bacterium]|nr:MAG: ankyrin repeat domain-containing protein [Phycisphaerales bacterium]